MKGQLPPQRTEGTPWSYSYLVLSVLGEFWSPRVGPLFALLRCICRCPTVRLCGWGTRGHLSRERTSDGALECGGNMKKVRSISAVVAAAFVVGVGTTAVAAPAVSEDPPALVSEILEDAAAGEVMGDSVEAEVGGVDVSIPEEIAEPITLSTETGAAFSLQLPQGVGTVDSAADGERAAVTHELGDGSSLVPLVREDGVVQVLSVLSGPESPSTFDYVFDSSEGSRVVLTPGGGAEVFGDDGDSIATIEAPWATDAAGKSVPTRFAVENSTLTQIIEVADLGSVVYPIVADPAISVTSYEYKAVNVNKTANWANTKKQIGVCQVRAGAGGGTCTISNSYTVGTTVDTSFGLTSSKVAASIGISASKSVSGSVSWTSPVTKAGTTYKAWAIGTHVNYRIQKWKVTKAGGQTARKLMSTSGVLQAFSPVRGFSVGR